MYTSLPVRPRLSSRTTATHPTTDTAKTASARAAPLLNFVDSQLERPSSALYCEDGLGRRARPENAGGWGRHQVVIPQVQRLKGLQAPVELEGHSRGQPNKACRWRYILQTHLEYINQHASFSLTTNQGLFSEYSLLVKNLLQK